MLNLYDTITTVIRDVLRLEGVDKIRDDEILKLVEDKIVSEGKMPSKFLRTIQDIMKSKKDYDEKKLSKVDVEKIHIECGPLIKFLVEHMQRKRSKELERLKIRVKHGNKFGEVILLGNEAYIITDVDSEEKEVNKAKINEDGGLSTIEKSSFEDMEKALVNISGPQKASIKEPMIESLKRIFGKDFEIIVNY